MVMDMEYMQAYELSSVLKCIACMIKTNKLTLQSPCVVI